MRCQEGDGCCLPNEKQPEMKKFLNREDLYYDLKGERRYSHEAN